MSNSWMYHAKQAMRQLPNTVTKEATMSASFIVVFSKMLSVSIYLIIMSMTVFYYRFPIQPYNFKVCKLKGKWPSCSYDLQSYIIYDIQYV